jgi:hypothetical protein
MPNNKHKANKKNRAKTVTTPGPDIVIPSNSNTTNPGKKKNRVFSSWKNKDRIIKKGDNIMDGGLSTDIVIPCDSITIFCLITNTYQFSVLWVQPELEKAVYAPLD